MADTVIVKEVVTEVIVYQNGGPPEILQSVNPVTEIIVEAKQGLQGVQGPPGNSVPAVSIAYGDATPETIYTPSSDQIITSLTIVVTEEFNGSGAKISIGTDAEPELLAVEVETDMSVLGAFGFEPKIEIESGTEVKVFITPGGGATQGQATILIEYAEV